MYIVKYSGPFGFIKPWTAVRDSETFSQQFLTQSIIEGIEKKLFPELLNEKRVLRKIVRHRLNYQGIDIQQERTWSKGGFIKEKKKDITGREYYKPKNLGIINRGVLLNPNLYLAFANDSDAKRAVTQSICLCRNEDILLPEFIVEMTDNEFNEIEGFELIFSNDESGFKVGHNRFNKGCEMYGDLIVIGNPIRN